MNRLTSDSSLDGDESTVSSKSNRHRPLDEVNGDSNAENAQQVAEFSDMPSLASYRADEVSLASTLCADCDQSLPSVSSYRTKDMSVASGSTKSKSSTRRDGNRLQSNVDDDESDQSGTERTRGNLSTSGKLTIGDSIQENSTKPYSSTSRDEDPSSNTTNLSRGGDCMPRLPTRRPMYDSNRSECDSESEMTDDSPDVSIDTDEENDDIVETAHGPSHIVSKIPQTRRLSPTSPKSQARSTGVLPDLDGNTGAAIEEEKTSPGEPPAFISTPPSDKFSKGTKKSPKKQDFEAAPSQPELQQSPDVVDGGKEKRWRKMKSKDGGKSKKALDRTTSGSGIRPFGKKNKSDKSRGVRRAKSEMASLLDSIKPEDEKKRGILKRFSSSLRQMVRPSRTISSTFGNSKTVLGGKKRSKLKRMAKTSADEYKTGSA